jgi:hypothetical protein
VSIARRDRIADAEQLEAAFRVGHDVLGFTGDQIVLSLLEWGRRSKYKSSRGRVPWLITT